MTALLTVKNLHVQFRTYAGLVHALRGVDFELDAGDIVGIVGESGCGKTVTASAVMGIIPSPPGEVIAGEAWFDNRDLLKLPESEMRLLRGNLISMIFQDPMTSLNPYLTVERQMTEVLELHKGLGRRAARAQAIRLLDAVKIPEAASRIDMYPHEFSGGMRQRVMIAMALMCEPEVLIADEPTTALDVTVQAQIIVLLRELQREFGTAIVMITHDLGVVAGICDKVLVMYAGRTMEYGRVNDIFYRPSHPYTEGLLRAIPRLDTEGEVLPTIPGNPPNLLRLPTGCPFQERCHRAHEICGQQSPVLTPFGDGRTRACHWVSDAMIKGVN